jgi:ABC-type transport system involved in cytochrome bd biosynthesis fused ATPase/permease subunit
MPSRSVARLSQRIGRKRRVEVRSIGREECLDARTPAAVLPRDRTGDVIDVRGVSMRYSGADGGVLALKDINFAVADGEFMAIVGPAGCGANYQAYYDWLLQQNVIKQKLDAQEAFTNDLIDDINKFDAAEVTEMAKAYKGK